MIKDDFARFRLDILVKSFIAGGVIIIAGFLFKGKFFSFGYSIGLLASVSYFSNIYSSVRAIQNRQVRKIKLYLTLHYILFYFVIALALAASFLKNKSMFIGAIAGLLSIKAVIFADAFIGKKWTPHL